MLAALQTRLLELRLELGGQTARPPRPAAVRAVRGLGRLGQGRRDQAARGRAGPAARARQAVRGADARRAAPPLPAAVRPALPGEGGMAVLDRSWYGRVLVERVEGFATKAEVEARLPRDQRLRARAVRRRDDPRQGLAARLRRRAAQALQGAREGPAEVLEADRRGLAQPREAARSTRPRSRRWCGARPPTARRGSWSRASRSATPGRRCCAA